MGKNSIVQDRAHVASEQKKKGDKIVIGDNAFIGCNARVDCATLESYSYVGMGAYVGRGSVVEGYAMVAAGANVLPGTVVPSGQVWAGNPAVYLRDLTQEEKHMLSEYLVEMQQLSQIFAEETERTFREVLEDEERRFQSEMTDPFVKV